MHPIVKEILGSRVVNIPYMNGKTSRLSESWKLVFMFFSATAINQMNTLSLGNGKKIVDGKVKTYTSMFTA